MTKGVDKKVTNGWQVWTQQGRRRIKRLEMGKIEGRRKMLARKLLESGRDGDEDDEDKKP